ncbi:hypothetical protein C4J81_12905 [Deltaproteobacteria bacterium Smac51]|nr:hypothetical protein C4J81_12905 [Deltaproteobacteria bacterium Smac51]
MYHQDRIRQIANQLINAIKGYLNCQEEISIITQRNDGLLKPYRPSHSLELKTYSVLFSAVNGKSVQIDFFYAGCGSLVLEEMEIKPEIISGRPGKKDIMLYTARVYDSKDMDDILKRIVNKFGYELIFVRERKGYQSRRYFHYEVKRQLKQ